MACIPETYVEGFHDLESVKRMEYKPLGKTGLIVSKLSLGVSSLGSVFRKTDDEESYDVVEYAIKSGINYLDVSPFYGIGKAERILGEALSKKNIPRNAYYVATKVGRYDLEKFDFSAERVIRSVDESLQRIGIKYIDVIQVHDMEFADSIDVILNETLPALHELKKQGKVGFIGVTGYPLSLFKTVIERSKIKIDTILTYCHYTLNDTSLLEYLSYFKSNDIGVVNASPTGMGLLTVKGTAAWHPASEKLKNVCKEAALYCQECEVDIAKLALHFTCNSADIPTTLVSTASLQNMKSNIQACCNPLSHHEEHVLQTIRDRFFIPLQNETWEDVEVKKFCKEKKI